MKRANTPIRTIFDLIFLLEWADIISRLSIFTRISKISPRITTIMLWNILFSISIYLYSQNYISSTCIALKDENNVSIKSPKCIKIIMKNI